MAVNQRQRFVVAGGIVLIAIIGMLAFFGANTSVKVMTVEEAMQPSAAGQRVEVTGNVVNNSFDIQGDILTFHITDPDNPETDLLVRYDRGVSATFGNGVTAICTGMVDETGQLVCSELVTKCPSKYETATDALSVERLLGYGDAITDKVVKVAGIVKTGSLSDATADVRLVLADKETGDTFPVVFKGALSDAVAEGAAVVLQGSLGADGTFTATEVALEG